MKSVSPISLLIAVTLFLITGSEHGSAHAQNPGSNSHKANWWWLVGGVGSAATEKGPTHAAYMMSLTYSTSLGFLSARYIGGEEFQIVIWGSAPPPDKFGELGLLYNVNTRGGHGALSGMLAASAGVSMARISYRKSQNPPGSLEQIHRTTVGLPLELSAFWDPVTFLGIGLTAFADVNSTRSFAGGLLSLQLGRLH